MIVQVGSVVPYCPLCGGQLHISEGEPGFRNTNTISCEKCSANYSVEEWSDTPMDWHKFRLDIFEDQEMVAETMKEMFDALNEMGLRT